MNTVVCDIDGVLVDLKERLPYFLNPNTDWNEYYKTKFEDKPIKPIVDLVKTLSINHTIVFCTGRRERDRHYTQLWLSQYFDLSKTPLLMRPDDDERPDMVTKPELLAKWIKEEESKHRWGGITLKVFVDFILEDRNSMVAKWRELGYTVLQPALGDF